MNQKCFDGCENLIDLNINKNLLTVIKSSVFEGLENLEWLDIRDYKIQDLDERCFDGCQNLQRVDLSNNNLKCINSNIFNELKYLEFIDLKENKIDDLSEGCFNGCERLKKIIISINYQLSKTWKKLILARIKSKAYTKIALLDVKV